MFKNYSLINDLYKYGVIEKLPKLLIRKIRKKFNIHFIPTDKKVLSEQNYPLVHNYEAQNELIKHFKLKKKQTSFNTCRYLIPLLTLIFEKNNNFNFLDIGGENIDFYLELKEKFPFVKYFVFNQKIILDNFKKIKIENNLKDFNLIYNVDNLSENNYDFINLGSVIQYIKEYQKLLLKLIDVSNNYIFFSGTHLFNSGKKKEDNIIVKQVNLLPHVSYLYFICKEYFYKNFFNNGYKIVFETKNHTSNTNYKNFEKTIEGIEYTDVLFKK